MSTQSFGGLIPEFSWVILSTLAGEEYMVVRQWRRRCPQLNTWPGIRAAFIS